MSEADDLRAFLFDAVEDLGGSISECDGVLEVGLPPEFSERIELAPRFTLTCATPAASHADAELLAPGSYVLERFSSLMMRRGRWDSARLGSPPDDWVTEALRAHGLDGSCGLEATLESLATARIWAFTFRVTLVADEKREMFFAVLVREGEPSGWIADWEPLEVPLEPAPIALDRERLMTSYRIAAETLTEHARPEVRAFRKTCLTLLDEEVGRIFRYFDRTVDEIRQASPADSEGLLRAIEAERGRRLVEAAERFTPRAQASLCAVRYVEAPEALVALCRRNSDETLARARVDAWSRVIRGIQCASCNRTQGPWRVSQLGAVECIQCLPMANGSARPPSHRPSGTHRRGRKASQGRPRSPRGCMARSRAAVGSHRHR